MYSFLCYLLSFSFFFVQCLSFSHGGFTMDLFHRESFHSPSYQPTKTAFERLRGSINRSLSRKTSTFGAPTFPAGGEYLMKISVGTPAVEVLGILDTGSDLTWLQCKPCKECYHQNLPTFDPSGSSSYRPVSCESDQCKAASGESACDTTEKSCQYEVVYGDGSFSTGELVEETLTFDSNVSFPKVAIGCGHENDGNFNETGSGLVGLGGGSISIVNQLRSSIGGRFSYCLTPLDSNATSKISFGSDAVVSGVSTPLANKSASTFYTLTLEAMSVGSERVENVPAGNASSASPPVEGNIIIDSGTTLTILPTQLLKGVVSAMQKLAAGTQVSDPQQLFPLCYQGVFSFPPVTAHFKNADLVLPEQTTFIEVAKGISCLALVPLPDISIFGYLHQMNYQVGYDLVKGEVSFLATDCSK